MVGHLGKWLDVMEHGWTSWKMVGHYGKWLDIVNHDCMEIVEHFWKRFIMVG
jgi:hypothetical protein